MSERVSEQKRDFLLAVNRMLDAAEDARACRDAVLKAAAQQAEMPCPDLLDEEVVAELIERSVDDVGRLHASGRLPHPLVSGAMVRWHRDAIEQWLRDGRPRAAGEEADHAE